MGWGGLIGGAAGFYFGGPAGAAAGYAIGSQIDGEQAVDQANSANKELSFDARRWQENMSNTAFRRARVDLEGAGLNPILATGAQASTPTPQVPQMESKANAIQSGARDFVGAMTTMQQAQKQKSEIDLLNSQKKQSDAQTLKTTVEAAVAKKGIPGSELQNDIYDVIRPAVKKLKEGMNTNSWKPSENEQSIDLKKFKQKFQQGAKP